MFAFEYNRGISRNIAVANVSEITKPRGRRATAGEVSGLSVSAHEILLALPWLVILLNHRIGFLFD
jgi:hypothetical protein